MLTELRVRRDTGRVARLRVSGEGEEQSEVEGMRDRGCMIGDA